jgi:hypothetical protein
MNESETFVKELFARTDASIRAVRGDADKEAAILSGAVRELMTKYPDAKAPHIFSSEGWGEIDPLFDTLAPNDEEFDRWCDVLSDSWEL